MSQKHELEEPAQKILKEKEAAFRKAEAQEEKRDIAAFRDRQNWPRSKEPGGENR